jgi:hypothetical protein
MIRRTFVCWFAVLAVLITGSALAQWPNSIVSLGDSITRAALANNTIGGLDYGQPQHSWATGYQAGDGVDSHYERIRAVNPTISGHRWTLAHSGDKADDLPGQANAAVATGAEYVVIQMGANDVCAMTPTSTFLAHYEPPLELRRPFCVSQAALADSCSCS